MKPASLLLLILIGGGASAAPVDCLDTEAALQYWKPIRERAPNGDLDADTLAIELVSCLGSPNRELRDGIGYELYTFWLRSDVLTDDTRRTLLVSLRHALSGADALRRSFSALVLAELMRSDANAPFMSAVERGSLLTAATTALVAETDYRGLDPDLGWVHPVAHEADLLWRFALHDGTTADDARRLLDAIRSQVAPVTVAYAFNEGDRLARIVATIIRRELLPHDVMADWIASFRTPKSMDRWSLAFQSPSGMTELHNTKQFLRALSDQLADADVPESVREALDELVVGFTQLI